MIPFSILAFRHVSKAALFGSIDHSCRCVFGIYTAKLAPVFVFLQSQPADDPPSLLRTLHAGIAFEVSSPSKRNKTLS